MMTMMLRVVLILVSAATMIMMIQKIRKAKLQIEDSIFWVLVSFMFVLFSLFPPVADFLAHLLGIYATVNFLFLLMIFHDNPYVPAGNQVKGAGAEACPLRTGTEGKRDKERRRGLWGGRR